MVLSPPPPSFSLSPSLPPLFLSLFSYTTAAGLCSRRIDLAFVLDSTTGTNDLPNILDFTNKVINNFDISTTATQVSVVQFSNDDRTPIPLGAHTSKGPLTQAISRLLQFGSTAANIVAGIEEATTELTSSRSRPMTKKVIILVTGKEHGVSTSNDVMTAAENAKNEGIELIAIGSGVMDSTLTTIASNTRTAFSLPSLSVEDLNGIVTNVSSAACFGSKCSSSTSYVLCC